MTITETKIAFVYAGHTFRINLETDEYGNECFDLILVGSVPLDERGTYPANHAKFEAMELITFQIESEGNGRHGLIPDLIDAVLNLVRSGELEKAGN